MRKGISMSSLKNLRRKPNHMMCTQVNSEYNLKKAQRKKDNSITKFWPLEVKYIQYLFLS